MAIKKLFPLSILSIAFILLLSSNCFAAQGYKTRFNPFTGKQDYIIDVSNIEAGSITATGTVTGAVVSATGALQVGSDYITDITGSGLSVVGGKLTAGGSESTTVSDTTTINLTMTGTDITADGLYTAGDNLTLTGADFDLDQSINLTNVSATNTVTGVVVDTQFLENAGGSTVTVRDGLSVNNSLTVPNAFVHDRCKCALVEDLVATDDNKSLGVFNIPVTITGVSAVNYGTATTASATIVLADGAGNAMTITGTNPTVVTPSSIATFAPVTAGNTLVTGEVVNFSVTNTPAPTTDDYLICIKYTE